MIKETGNVATLIKKNADTLYSQTIEKLVILIEEKKDLKNRYTEERKRLDEDFRKVKLVLCYLTMEYWNLREERQKLST